MVKGYKTGLTAVQNHINHPQVQKLNYLDLFMRTRYAALDCDCFGPASPLACPFQECHSAPRHFHHQLYLRAVQQARLPKVSFVSHNILTFSFLFMNVVSHFIRIGFSDLHELISPRLPNELYFLLCQGGILPQVVNNLLSGALLEAPPLVSARQLGPPIPPLDRQLTAMRTGRWTPTSTGACSAT